MKPIALKFGGYQELASIHNRAAGRFGELLTRKLGDRISFELIGNVLKIGRAIFRSILAKPNTPRGASNSSILSAFQ